MVCQTAYQLDLHGYRDSPIHRLDTRAKILATLFFAVVVVSFPKYATVSLVPMALFPIVLLALGDVPGRLTLRFLVVAAPFALLVGALNPWLDKSTLRVGPWAVGAGWLSLTSILLRFVLTVSAVVGLMATSSFPRLCEALNRLRVPTALVVQLQLLYRYLFVLVDESDRMHHAYELRAGGRRRTWRQAGKMLSSLLVRAWDRADRVHQAMCLRGFAGQVHTLRTMQWRLRDTLFLAACCLGLLAVRLFPVVDGLGRLVTGGVA